MRALRGPRSFPRGRGGYKLHQFYLYQISHFASRSNFQFPPNLFCAISPATARHGSPGYGWLRPDEAMPRQARSAVTSETCAQGICGSSLVSPFDGVYPERSRTGRVTCFPVEPTLRVLLALRNCPNPSAPALSVAKPAGPWHLSSSER